MDTPQAPSRIDHQTPLNPLGKVAVISGGASGLGLATAQRLGAAGAIPVILDLVRAADSDLESHECDVTSAQSLEHVIETIVETHGQIDICVNCAGIGGLEPIATAERPADLQAFQRILNVNVMGSVNLTRLAAHRMIANDPEGPDGERGVIINAASIASFEGQQGMGAYTASKAALAALTLVWARDLSRYNIRCMSIAAGFFATPMTAGIPAPLVSELLTACEFPRRAGTPAEFAELALFIVGNPLLNADVIRLDGGTRPPARTAWTGD
jgi:NAD(P)-dependent dehydrogenase (short-subunit alcohol dehydrogenase family)